jgi:hypothetical protein
MYSSTTSCNDLCVASSSACPTFTCACCGLTKAVQKQRRYVTRATVAVATCMHKGFAKSLELPFPLDACHTCYVIAKKATDLFRWSFPSEYSFVSEDPRYGKRPAKAFPKAQVRLFSHHPVLIPFPAPSFFVQSHLISGTHSFQPHHVPVGHHRWLQDTVRDPSRSAGPQPPQHQLRESEEPPVTS